MKILTIGRGPDNDIVINDHTVSRHHVQLIQHNDGRFSISDIGSKNGTFVNGKRIIREVQLHSEDVVQIGRIILPWTKYFSAVTINPKKRCNKPFVILGSIGATIVTILYIVYILINGFGIFKYDTNNVNTQVLVIFSDNVSPSLASLWLRAQGSKILESNESFGYFLICNKDEKTSEKIYNRFRTSNYIHSVLRNQFIKPCSISMTAIDNFEETKGHPKKISHGEMVSRTMSGGGKYPVHSYMMTQNTFSELTKGIMETCNSMSDDDMNIINLSWGIPDSLYDSKQRKYVERKTWERYKEDYAEDVIWLAEMVNKCNKNNLIITKAMGNEAHHNIDEAFVLALEKMDDKQKQAIKDHVVFVAAKDQRKGFYNPQLDSIGYSNTLRHKVPGINTIMADLTQFPSEQSGTSAAAPYIASLLARAKVESARVAIAIVEKSTEGTELVSESYFMNIAQSITHNPEAIDNTQKNIENESSTSSSLEATIEGVLKMYVLDPSGNSRLKIAMHDLDQTDDYVAFVLESENPIDITPYLDINEQELLDNNTQSTFMIHVNSNSSLRKFASKYAYKRVRVKGTFSVPGAGWRNATEVVMMLREITLCPVSDVTDKKSLEEQSLYKVPNHSYYVKINEDLKLTLDDDSNGFVRLYTFGLGDLSLKISWSGTYPIKVNWRLDGHGLAPSSGVLFSEKVSHGQNAISYTGKSNYTLYHYENFEWTASDADAKGVWIDISRVH